MSAPRWSRALLRRLAADGREDEILGDHEEAHRARVKAKGRLVGGFLAALETFDMAFALLRQRRLTLGMSVLDFKLGVRMLIRYPGLTVLGGLAIAFAICAGAGTFEFLTQVGAPKMPFAGGDRLVALELWDAKKGGDYNRALFDVGVWQQELTSLEEIGAFQSVTRNVIVDEAAAHVVVGALMDAAGFRITGIRAMMGRTFTDDDQRPDAPPVVVIGHKLWQSMFGSDPAILGRVVKVGTEPATVVGVMPEGFSFPIAHQLWLPLKDDRGSVEPGGGPAVSVFARLAPGVSRDAAQARISAIGARLSAAYPDSHESVRPFVRPYGIAMMGLPASSSDGLISAVVMAWNIPLVLFLILVCGNVALLMFARAAARESELVVRSALGASRRRIVGQLFAEALVLAAIGAAIGLSVAEHGLRWAYHVVEVELWKAPLPFWFQPELSLRTVVYTLVLTLIAAGVAGVIPGLKASRGLGPQLRAAAGGGGHRFGGIWTFVIISQIAITVCFPVVAFSVATEGRQIRMFNMGIPAHEYLTAHLTVPEQPMEAAAPGSPIGAAAPAEPLNAAPPPEPIEAARPSEPDADQVRSRVAMAGLEEKLLADPRVLGMTFAERAPRQYNGWNQIEVDGPTAPPQDERGHRLGRVSVEPDFFRTLGIQPRAGRDFHPADATAGSDAVIVNEAFIDYVLGGRSAIGVTFRYVASERDRSTPEEGEPWLRIVGVVQNLGAMSGYSSAIVYHAVPDLSMNPAYAIIHVRGDAGGFAPTLRKAAFDVDPTLRIGDTVTLDRMVDSTVAFYRFWVITLGLASLLGVILSVGGIYAVMSFTVSRRTREIGVRVALGASKTRVVLAIFRRPLVQVALGLLAGGLLMTLLLGLAGSMPSMRVMAGFAGYMAGMAAICLLGCLTPTRRALAVEPSEALRAE
ncbi:MAG: ABC transporter permease [Gemmatimonadetes bacterium]|nr:ABC transporter permease [Gemmatimonadota bacterium]